MALPNGVLLPEAAAVEMVTEIRSAAERFGEQVTVDLGRAACGTVLCYGSDSEREIGFRILQELYESVLRHGLTIPQNVPLIEMHLAREMCRRGDVDGAIALARSAFDECFRAHEAIWQGAIAGQLVELFVRRGSDLDLCEARAVVDRLAAVPTEPGFVVNEIWLLRLRAVLARAAGDMTTYVDLVARYRRMANDLGFEGHIALAATMAEALPDQPVG
ncbi:hypothetical protein [Mycolicibacterium sp. GF69]|uniref:hypothetical protein n=1 Tax=Mycolicibacterium sp. GF69 TaxID=2267251 RepID=UPI0026D880FB